MWKEIIAIIPFCIIGAGMCVCIMALRDNDRCREKLVDILDRAVRLEAIEKACADETMPDKDFRLFVKNQLSTKNGD